MISIQDYYWVYLLFYCKPRLISHRFRMRELVLGQNRTALDYRGDSFLNDWRELFMISDAAIFLK